MLRVIGTFLFFAASLLAVFAEDAKTRDPIHAPSHGAQGPYGALPQIASDKNKPKAADALAGQLLQLGAMRLEADALNASSQPPRGAMRRPRAFDASEGTALDPLRNDTFDLTHPHEVPSLK
jgi:UPF0755 protein